MDLSSGGPWLSFEKIVHEINQHCYKNQKSCSSEFIKNIKNSDGKSSQNCSEAAEFFNVHFSNLKLPSIVSELDSEYFLNNLP